MRKVLLEHGSDDSAGETADGQVHGGAYSNAAERRDLLRKGRSAQSMRKTAMAEDITGNRFGRLVVTSMAEKKNGMSLCNCLCDCGNVTVVYAKNLKRGYTQSCGCYRHECEAKTQANNRRPKTGRVNQWR